jgi:hypothetical protein
MAPLGYDTKDRKITVNDAEADRVRDIFRSYLKLGSLNLLTNFRYSKHIANRSAGLGNRKSGSSRLLDSGARHRFPGYAPGTASRGLARHRH